MRGWREESLVHNLVHNRLHMHSSLSISAKGCGTWLIEVYRSLWANQCRPFCFWLENQQNVPHKETSYSMAFQQVGSLNRNWLYAARLPGTWHMHEQCVPGSPSLSYPAWEPGNKANQLQSSLLECIAQDQEETWLITSQNKNVPRMAMYIVILADSPSDLM